MKMEKKTEINLELSTDELKELIAMHFGEKFNIRAVLVSFEYYSHLGQLNATLRPMDEVTAEQAERAPQSASENVAPPVAATAKEVF